MPAGQHFCLASIGWAWQTRHLEGCRVFTALVCADFTCEVELRQSQAFVCMSFLDWASTVEHAGSGQFCHVQREESCTEDDFNMSKICRAVARACTSQMQFT